MIIIQEFPSVAALQGWLHNQQYRKGDWFSFITWLYSYTYDRELIVRERVYRYHDCIEILNASAC